MVYRDLCLLLDCFALDVVQSRLLSLFFGACLSKGEQVYPRDLFQTYDLSDTTETCFVLMPFADDFAAVWQNYLKPAIEISGLQAERADNKSFASSPILMVIIEGIARAKLVVADLTGMNPNVFYEVGLAHATKHNSQVILLTQDTDDIPFDLRHLRCYKYALNDKAFKPSVDDLARILRGALDEYDRVQAIEMERTKRGLNPPAVELLTIYQGEDLLRFDDALFSPKNFGDILSGLRLSLGLSNLIQDNLVELVIDEAQQAIRYRWTNKARRVFGVGHSGAHSRK